MLAWRPNLRRRGHGVATDFSRRWQYTDGIFRIYGGAILGIYLDLVVVLNFLVDFLLFVGTNRLTGYPSGIKRCLISGALGGLYAGACMIPGFHFLGNGFWRVVCLILMGGIAFGWNRSGIQRGAIFLLLTMAMGGIATGLHAESFWTLVGAGIGIWMLCRMGFRGGQKEYVPIVLSWNDRQMSLIALRDTGNTLRDPVTGESVLVAGADVAEKLLGLTPYQLSHPVETLASGCVPGIRLIPYHAVGQPGGLLIAVRFHQAKIGNTYAEPLVAFAPEVLAKGEVYQMLTGGVI